MHRKPPVLLLLIALLAALLVACGGGEGDTSSEKPAGPTTTAGPRERFQAQVASYELIAGQDQRFLAALAGNGTGTIVSFGAVDLDFFYLGTKEVPVDPPQFKMTAKAPFIPVAGQHVDPNEPGPREAKPSEGIGVYSADRVRFDTAGFWGVTIKAKIGGTDVSANAPFEVLAESQLPFPGKAAPRTKNPTSGASGVDPVSIDSRASDGSPIPDSALHSISIADALASGKPTVVVVSTPVYCVSQFCGPITDTVGELAGVYGDRVAFVHLEVWQNFEKKVLSPYAAEWIQPGGGRGDTQEPWVFLVGGDGIVRERFDNVLNKPVLEASVKRLLGQG